MAYFSSKDEAERYARSRPFFRPLALDRALAALNVRERIPLAIDVGCGTGQSAVALLDIAESVVGIDISQGMLLYAERRSRVHYAQAFAESMPLRSDSTPLMTTALAFHWFDRERFLREAWRVIRGEGWLVVYNNGFRGIMRENPGFRDWGREVYLKRFPTPPRDSQPLTLEQAGKAGIAFIGEDTFDNEVTFTPEELVAYLLTQSNIVAAVDSGRDTLESAQAWLLDQVRLFFGDMPGTFVFGTRSWYLQKQLHHE